MNEYSERVARLVNIALNSDNFYLDFLSAMERELKTHISLVNAEDEYIFGNSKYDNCIPLGTLGTLYLYQRVVANNIDYIRLAAALIHSKLEIDYYKRYKNIYDTLAADAINLLTNKELIGVRAAISSMDSDKCIVNTSSIAKKCNITRSIIVNGLHKLECAGFIEVHSVGPKGTSIKIINSDLLYKLDFT